MADRLRQDEQQFFDTITTFANGQLKKRRDQLLRSVITEPQRT